MQASMSHKSSCRHGVSCFPTSIHQFIWYQGSGLQSGGCFVTLPVPVLMVHTSTWAGNVGKGGGIGGGPQHISVEILCMFGDQQWGVEWCTASGRIQPRLPKGPAASPHPSSTVIYEISTH